MANRPVDEYLAMPYSKVLVPDETGGFVAELLEFPGCLAEGETADEAIGNLNDAMEVWIEAVLESGDRVPEPLDLQGYGGRLVVRMPKWVHKEATRRAHVESVSLNQWIVGAIGERLGADRSQARLQEVLSGFGAQPPAIIMSGMAPMMSRWSGEISFGQISGMAPVMSPWSGEISFGQHSGLGIVAEPGIQEVEWHVASTSGRKEVGKRHASGKPD